jgi:hypothetical protein
MRPADSAEAWSKCEIIGCLVTGLSVGLSVCLVNPVVLAAQEATSSCNPASYISEDFLGCVRGVIDTVEKGQIKKAVTDEPLRSYLRTLASTVGYPGSQADLDALKSRSTELKVDPVVNRDAIALLDNAIASHVAELRPAVSRETAAAAVTPGTDIYRRFVEQKIEFLNSDKVKFYDGGPFEIATRSALANTLEAQYFLAEDKQEQSPLRREIQVLEELGARLVEQKYAYLWPEAKRQAPQRQSEINSNLFWRASILFAIGEKEKLRGILRDIAYQNSNFGIDAANPGHVYIYKVFDFPFKLTVQGVDAGGKPLVLAKDPHILNGYYNPAQLALRVCGLVDAAGPKAIETWVDAIDDLVFNDFYVIVASADESKPLVQLVAAISQALDNRELGQQRDNLVKSIAAQAEVFSQTMERGAGACGIDDSVRGKVYAPFEFRTEIKHIEGLGNHREHLLIGGNLSANQSNMLFEFLNHSVFTVPSVRSLQEKLGIVPTAYAARVRTE